MLQVSNRNYERISRINSGMESRLSTYKLKLEVQRQRFLRHMIYAQSFLRSECKRLKDEKFRNHSEKKLLRKNEIGKKKANRYLDLLVTAVDIKQILMTICFRVFTVHDDF